MAHKSVYIVENQQKYIGKINNIVCRSSWERGVCKWLDSNKDILKWSSEEVVISYVCGTDNRHHRYFIDFYVEMTNGKKFIIEVKPYSQTQPPKLPKSGRETKTYKNAVKTFVKNQSKWYAARSFAARNGLNFVIWTEHTLKKLGIRIVA